MKKPHLPAALLLAVFAAIPCSSQVLQTTPPGGEESANQSPPHLAGTVRVTLERRLELKKLKVGEELGTKLTEDMKVGGQTVAPKNSRMVGRVAELMSRERGDPMTRLAIVFERIVKKNGSELPIYGIVSGVVVPRSDSGENLADLQAARLEIMRAQALSGTESPETRETINALYRTARTNLPTTASGQWNCQRTVGEWLYCAPANHFVERRPAIIAGMDNVILQIEKTPQGTLGVLVTDKKNMTLNGGIDLMVRMIPQR